MFEVTLETQGLQGVTQVLESLQQLGSRIGAVVLNPIKRKPYDLDGRKFGDEATNAEILKYLKLQKRDFLTQSDSDNNAIADAVAKEAERQLQEEFSKAAAIDKWMGQRATAKKKYKAALKKGRDVSAGDYFRDLGDFASELSGQMLMVAMKMFMSQVYDRIERQTTNNPPFNDELSEEWTETKKKLTGGWIKPIGKLSGQLIDNLNPDGIGARNIRLKKA